MADATIMNHSLGSRIAAIRRQWGWLLVLGIGMLVAGGIAAANLMVATVVSVLYVGAMMVVVGVLEIVHGFTDAGVSRRIVRFASGLVYAVAGIIALYNPLMASVGFTLALGILLLFAAGFRLAAALHEFGQPGSTWLIVASLLTGLAGVLVLMLWPGSSLWLLGAVLTADLILQGWSFIAFSLALRSFPVSSPITNPDGSAGAAKS